MGDGYSLKGTGHFEYGNNTEAGGIKPAGTGDLVDYSYYLGPDPCQPPPVPEFWNIPDAIPTIGLPRALGPSKNIPALERFFQEWVKLWDRRAFQNSRLIRWWDGGDGNI